MKPVYTIPKIHNTGKDWYVWFRYNKVLIKKRYDINRIKDLKERQKQIEVLQSILLDQLKRDWNPLVPDLAKQEGKDFTLYQALEFALDKKQAQICAKTYSGYIGTLRFAKTAIQELNLGYLPITDTKRVHIKTILEHLYKKRSWSNNAYNKHLGHLQAVLSELIQWDIIQFNPAHNIKKMTVMDVKANIPPTPSQFREIEYHLKSKHYGLYAFMSIIYHTGIRPVEITRMKMGMLNRTRMEFVLPASITKTKKQRIVPINEFLWNDLKPIFEKEYPDSFYMFGSGRPSGKGNIGLHKDFNPGITKMNRDTVTKRWEKVVKIGLGIPVNLYSIKKLGANAKIMAGMSIRALQELFGHSSEVTTEIYITKLEEVIRKEILEKSPKMG